MSAIIQKIDCRARYHLRAPFVRIFYEIANSVNGRQLLTLGEDFYPNPLPTAPGDQFAPLEFTVNLLGVQENIVSASLVCDPISPADPQWWLRKHPKYTPWDATNPADADNPIADFSIDPASIRRAPSYNADNQADAGYQNESRSRSIPAWTGFKTQHITISANARVTYRNGKAPLTVPLAFQCASTNATTGHYSQQQIVNFAEPVPAGLARNIYDAINVLQFEGEVVLQEEEVSGQLLIGSLFNLTGSASAEWAGMNAQVQEVVEDLETGQTTVRFGPPKHLSAGELVDLLRVNRFRFISNPFSQAITGDTGGSGNVDLTADSPEKNSSHAEGPDQVLVVSSTVDGSGPIFKTSAFPGDIISQWLSDTPGTGSITINLGRTGGQALIIQSLELCENGVQGTRRFLCSDFIPDPT